MYVLLTRAPLVSGIATLLPFDLHVLGLPLAFILSQDQTLRSKRVDSFFIFKKENGSHVTYDMDLIIILVHLPVLISANYVSIQYFKELFLTRIAAFRSVVLSTSRLL